MNRKRLGQLLIGGVFTLCAAAVLSLIELVAKEDEKPTETAPQDPPKLTNAAPTEK